MSLMLIGRASAQRRPNARNGDAMPTQAMFERQIEDVLGANSEAEC